MHLTAEQSKSVQCLRGLAIIAVVFIHNTPTGLSQVFIRPFLNFSVGLFLFLSGMLSNASNWSPKKRITKVLIPYILWTLIYSVLYNISSLGSIPVTFLKNLITAKASSVMYYIWVYCQFTLLIPLIDKLAKSKYKYLGFLISPIEIIVMRTIPLLIGLQINRYVDLVMDISCLGWFTYFYIGYLLGNNLITIKNKTKNLFFLWIGSILFQIVEGYFYYKLGDANCGTQLKLTAVISGVLFVLMSYHFISNGTLLKVNWLKILGDNSFGIYFSHLAVMAIIVKIPFYGSYVPYPITAIITLILTTACVLVGKRILGKYAKLLAL